MSNDPLWTHPRATCVGVSRNTVLSAYEQLTAEGYLESIIARAACLICPQNAIKGCFRVVKDKIREDGTADKVLLWPKA